VDASSNEIPLEVVGVVVPVASSKEIPAIHYSTNVLVLASHLRTPDLVL
jgi:hypothetical protein